MLHCDVKPAICDFELRLPSLKALSLFCGNSGDLGLSSRKFASNGDYVILVRYVLASSWRRRWKYWACLKRERDEKRTKWRVLLEGIGVWEWRCYIEISLSSAHGSIVSRQRDSRVSVSLMHVFSHPSLAQYSASYMNTVCY